MKDAMRARFTLIPGSCYRVDFNGQEIELVFEGRVNQRGIGLLKWHDRAGASYLNRVDDQQVVVIDAFV